ncbi:MAG TPA: penicillin acylase family protein [Candidatus Limnocylindria bacterium]|nr:penicillin acylase family protein [Candidatus Limnocylindria bacterium]
MPKRTVALALVLLVVLSIAGAAGFLIYRPQATLDGGYRLLGLDQRGEIVRDAYGVPHIYAQTAHDLFYLQGYATAQDRLFQLDLFRRTGRGRLSEVLGDAGLETDKFIRTIGLARAAALDEAVLSTDARLALASFAEGVNKLIEQQGDALPIEFLLLGYKPERWTATDSLVILKLESYDLATNYGTELSRANVAARAGPAALAELFPDTDLRPPAGTADGSWAAVEDAFRSPVELPGLAGLRTLFGDAGNGLGSNCIALAGSRTASGKPLLEGDPHLSVRNPSIWYEVGLHGGGYDVAGFSIPGLPGIGIGHNARVAWTFTVAYTDVEDFFVEQPDPTDPRRFMYQGAPEAATAIRELIRVKGRTDPIEYDVVITRHGPLMTGVLKGQQVPLALRWTALDGGRTLDSLLGAARATDWSSFRAAMADLSGATLSVCYADVDGHIGYVLAGALPDRAKGDGRLPVPGSTGEYEWRGVLPASANPARLDPVEGYIVNANDRPVTDPTSAAYIGEWDPGFRAGHLLAAAKDLGGATVETLRRIQTDYTSPPVAAFRDAILAATPRSPVAATAQDLVRRWDGTLSVDSGAAAIYESWIVHMTDRTFHDKLGDTVYLDYLANARPTFALYKMLPRPSDPWFVALGDPAVRGRDALSALALDDVVTDLRARLGPDPAKWRWGALHTVTFAHPLSVGLPALARALFDIGPYERAGDGYSVNSGDYSLTTPYTLRSHASERMLVDLGDLDNSRAVLPTGQSGQPRSRHWGDQTPLWLRGELHPMWFSRARITDPDVLVLRPR